MSNTRTRCTTRASVGKQQNCISLLLLLFLTQDQIVLLLQARVHNRVDELCVPPSTTTTTNNTNNNSPLSLALLSAPGTACNATTERNAARYKQQQQVSTHHNNNDNNIERTFSSSCRSWACAMAVLSTFFFSSFLMPSTRLSITSITWALCSRTCQTTKQNKQTNKTHRHGRQAHNDEVALQLDLVLIVQPVPPTQSVISIAQGGRHVIPGQQRMHQIRHGQHIAELLQQRVLRNTIVNISTPSPPPPRQHTMHSNAALRVSRPSSTRCLNGPKSTSRISSFFTNA